MTETKKRGRPAAIHEAFGERRTLLEWSFDDRFGGQPLATLRSRMRAGMSLEEALSRASLRSSRRCEVAEGIRRNILAARVKSRMRVLGMGQESDVAQALNMSRQLLNWRINKSTMTTANMAFLGGLVFLPSLVLVRGTSRQRTTYEWPPQGHLGHLRDLIIDGIEATHEDAYFMAIANGRE